MGGLIRFLESTPGRVLRYALSAAVLASLVLLVDWEVLTALRGQFEWSPVIWGVILAGLTLPLHGWRWWLLYRAQGITLPFSWAHAVTWIGHFYNAVLIGGIGGDAARAYYLCRDAPYQKTAGLASIAIDRVVGLVILVVIVVATAVAKLGHFSRQPELRALALGSMALLLVTAAGAFAACWFSPERWPARVKRGLGPDRLRNLVELHRQTLASPGAHLGALALALLMWLLDFVSVWLLARGLSLPLPFLETCFAVSVAYAATVLPISVGGHGVREGALLFTLGAFGLIALEGPAREPALLLAILVWAVTMLWCLAGGVVLLLAPPRPR